MRDVVTTSATSSAILNSSMRFSGHVVIGALHPQGSLGIALLFAKPYLMSSRDGCYSTYKITDSMLSIIIGKTQQKFSQDQMKPQVLGLSYI